MLYFSAHVYCRELEGGAILLDLRSGIYLGINAGDVTGLKGRIANWPTSRRSETHDVCPAIPAAQAANHPADRLIADLLERQILTALTPAATKNCPPIPLRSVTMTGRAISRRHVSLRRAFQLTLALLIVRIRTRRGRLEPLLNWLECRQHRLDEPTAPAAGDLEALLSSHCQWRIWFYTAHNHCLLDSLILSVFLTHYRVPSTFVIGIATKPFHAHAWVQIGECVLNESAEHVQMFVPILAVGDCVGGSYDSLSHRHR